MEQSLVGGTRAAYLLKTRDLKVLSRVLSRLSVLTTRYGLSLYKATPVRIFKIVWGLPAGAEEPQIQVLDNLPHYGS